MSQSSEKRGYREKEAAAYIGMSSSYLRRDRANGHRKRRTPGPRWITIGRAIRYLKEDLDAWLDQFRINGDGAPDDCHEYTRLTAEQRDQGKSTKEQEARHGPRACPGRLQADRVRRPRGDPHE